MFKVSSMLVSNSTVANGNTQKHVIDRTPVYTAVYGRKQTVIYNIIPYRNRNRKPSLKVLDGYGYGPRITDPYDAVVRCTVTSPTRSPYRSHTRLPNPRRTDMTKQL